MVILYIWLILAKITWIRIIDYLETLSLLHVLEWPIYKKWAILQLAEVLKHGSVEGHCCDWNESLAESS